MSEMVEYCSHYCRYICDRYGRTLCSIGAIHNKTFSSLKRILISTLVRMETYGQKLEDLPDGKSSADQTVLFSKAF